LRWIALLGLSVPLYATITLSPLLNGAAMDGLNIDSLQIGGIRTSEVLVNALLTIGLAPRLVRFEAKRLGLLGAGAMTLAAAASAFAGTPEHLLGARLLAGAGAGLCQCALVILMAQTQSPQRVGGSLMAPITGIAVVVALIGGQMTQAHGQKGVFLCLAGACSLGFALAYSGPRSFAATRRPQHGAAPATSLGALRSPYVLAAAMVFFGSTATWAFFERKGRSLGMAPSDISNLIAAALVAAGIFASLSMLVRDHRTKAFAIGAIAVFSAAAAATALSSSAAMFAAAYIVQTIAYAWAQNLLTALGVQLDATGGTAAAGRGWQTLVNAGAPALGGALVLWGGFPPLAIVCAAAGLWSVLFLIRSGKIAH